MTTIGILGAGEVGGQIARAAIGAGYAVIIANSRGPETLTDLVDELGPSACADTAAGAAAAGDFVVVAVPLRLENNMPVRELAGKIVLDTNNYMPWRDGHFPVLDSGEKTVHELRQEQLPLSKVAKAFTDIQAPRLLTSAKPAGSPRPSRALGLERLPRCRRIGHQVVRRLRVRHRRQQPPQRVVAQRSGPACVARTRTPDARRSTSRLQQWSVDCSTGWTDRRTGVVHERWREHLAGGPER